MNYETLRRNQIENQLLRQRQYQPNPPAQPWIPQGPQRESIWDEMARHEQIKKGKEK